MKYLEALRAASLSALTRFETSGLIAHGPTTGDEREGIVKAFIRPFLAECYGLDTGTAFSSQGEESRQLDLVLYDAVFSTVIPLPRTKHKLFPCESVYGNIEVKSRLDARELARAVENIESLKRLRRDPSDQLDFTPLARINLGDGLTYNREVKNRYLGGVFAWNGLTSDKVLEWLRGSSVDRSLLPDFVFNVKRQYVIVRCGDPSNGDLPISLSNDQYDGFAACEPGDNTLPLFALLLNSFLRDARLRQPDPTAFWLPLVQKLSWKRVRV